MAKIFISYSHQDGPKVQEIVKQIEDAGHDVWIDESNLQPSDPITPKIQESIVNVDYVIVFLSSDSVKSKWVRQEIYEALYQELQNKRVKLIPCRIEDCNLPRAFTKTKKFERIYISFIQNANNAMSELLSTLAKDPRTLFQSENYAILKIPYPNLNIYLTGEIYSKKWGKNEEMKYFETVDSYILYGFSIEPYTNFKHFVLCELSEAKDIRDKLRTLGYIVTGSGDIDDETGKRRIWFKIKENSKFSNHDFIIEEDNNQWATTN